MNTENLPMNVAGASSAAVIDYALERYWEKHPEARGKFPFTTFLNDKLPPTDDWLVGITSGLVTAIGVMAKNNEITELGKGGLIYSGGMLLHHTMQRSTWTEPLEPVE